jgi:hypothetical protein
MGEKAWSTPSITIHWCPENCQVGMQFMQKLVEKNTIQPF